MKKAIKKGLCLLLTVLTLCMVALPAGAVSNEAAGSAIPYSATTIKPFYINIISTRASLSISSGVANASSSVSTYSSCSIKIKMHLERKNSSGSWAGHVSWEDSYTGSYASMSKKWTNMPSGTYRVRTVFTVNSETATTYSAERSC